VNGYPSFSRRGEICCRFLSSLTKAINWYIGILEQWNIGILGRRLSIFTQCSSVPLFHYSIFVFRLHPFHVRPSVFESALQPWIERSSIPDFSCFGRPFNGLDYLSNQFISNDKFNLGLRQKINGIFGTAIRFGMTFLPSESLHFGYSHALNTNLHQSVFNLLQPEWLIMASIFFISPPFY